MGKISLYGLGHRICDIASKLQQRRVSRKLVASEWERVLQGPFRGTRMKVDPTRSGFLPMLIGTYELELRDWIEEAVRWKPSLVLNVGAASGYYAVGMALRLPNAKVVAFEMDPGEAAKCRDAARENRVEHLVEVRGKCEAGTFSDMTLARAMVISDCEGAEVDVFTDDVVRMLRNSWILLELHDALRPGCSREMYSRFRNSHTCRFVSALPRNVEDLDLPPHLSLRDQNTAVFENRLGVQEWALMTPRT